MKNNTTKQKEFNPTLNFNNVIISKVESDNGTITEIITFYNLFSDFETLVCGLNFGLLKRDEVVSVTHTANIIENGILKKSVSYPKIQFTMLEKMEATKNSYFFYMKKQHKQGKKLYYENEFIEHFKNNKDETVYLSIAS